MSNSHISPVKMEADLCSSKKDGRIAMALQQVVSAQCKAFKGALNSLTASDALPNYPSHADAVDTVTWVKR